jgi:REP element-mobilizing transposase RayT
MSTNATTAAPTGRKKAIGHRSSAIGNPAQPPAALGNPPPNTSKADAGSGDPAYNATRRDVGRVPSHGVPDQPPRRLRRLHRVWPDRDGIISYLLTICVDGRGRVLDNETTFERLISFLLDSPTRYRWFGRRFVIMPDHIHLITHMGHDAIRLGQWIKALKAVVGGLERRGECPVGTPGLQPPDAASGDAAYNTTSPADVGRVPSHGAAPTGRKKSARVGRLPSTGGVVGRVPPHGDHEFTRIKRAWRWQDGYHDHKFRTPESESRKWEYVCLNPVRAGLVKRPEEWPFGGEIFYDETGGPRLVRGTPPLLETGMLIEENDGGTTPCEGGRTPVEGNRPTT